MGYPVHTEVTQCDEDLECSPREREKERGRIVSKQQEVEGIGKVYPEVSRYWFSSLYYCIINHPKM